ncbi:MAG: hypothetical protein L0Z48_09295 [candidate division Zixibacteria bacterium]|nr:hypothetical protein [candidate division Zixibacteria bacterium]MCI0596716.1 hypothetical protein [candidate division Zixibacteria bacterium]
MAVGFYLFKLFLSLFVVLPVGFSLIDFLSKTAEGRNFLDKIDWNLLAEFFAARPGILSTLGISFLLVLPLVILGYIFFLGGALRSLDYSRGGGQYKVSGWTFFADSARFFKPLLLLQLLLYALYIFAVLVGMLFHAALSALLPNSFEYFGRLFWGTVMFVVAALPFLFVNLTGDFAKLILATEERKPLEAFRNAFRYVKANFKLTVSGYFILLGGQLFLSAVLLIAEKGLSLPTIFLGIFGQQLASLLKSAYRVFAFGAELEILKSLPPLPVKPVSLPEVEKTSVLDPAASLDAKNLSRATPLDEG